MNDRQREVYILLLRLYPDSPAVTVATACALEVLIADRLRDYEVARADDERGAAYAHWREAIGLRIAVYHAGVLDTWGVLTHIRRGRDGETWAYLDNGPPILLTPGMTWEVVGPQGWGRGSA